MRVGIKPETLQITGAFKIRGALNKALSLSREEIANGIIATSSGNHAQGLAYAARMLGVKAILVLPVTTPKIKIENTKALGAEVILFDGDTAARWKRVYEIAEVNKYAAVHAFEDPIVMAGQGTIGCEILQDLVKLQLLNHGYTIVPTYPGSADSKRSPVKLMAAGNRSFTKFGCAVRIGLKPAAEFHRPERASLPIATIPAVVRQGARARAHRVALQPKLAAVPSIQWR